MAGNGLSERLQTPISTAELERRWKAVRAAMKREGRRCPADAEQQRPHGRLCEVFHRYAGHQRLSQHGGLPGRRRDDRRLPGPVQRRRPSAGRHVARRQAPAHHAELRVRRISPSITIPELAAKALAPFAKGTIGMVGIYQMSFAMGDFIMKKFPSAKYVDASELVDRVKVIKSAEELELVKPRRHHAGRRDEGRLRRDQARHARHRSGRGRGALQPGSTAARTASISARRRRPARPAKFGQRHVQNRTIKKGDTLRAAGRGLRPRRACSPSSAAPACSARCRSR